VDPGLRALQVEVAVEDTRLDFGVLEPLVPAGDDNPVGAAVDRALPLAIVVAPTLAVRHACHPVVERLEMSIVVAGTDRRNPDAPRARVAGQQVIAADARALTTVELTDVIALVIVGGVEEEAVERAEPRGVDPLADEQDVATGRAEAPERVRPARLRH